MQVTKRTSDDESTLGGIYITGQPATNPVDPWGRGGEYITGQLVTNLVDPGGGEYITGQSSKVRNRWYQWFHKKDPSLQKLEEIKYCLENKKVQMKYDKVYRRSDTNFRPAVWR